jgi:hypothetical protein
VLLFELFPAFMLVVAIGMGVGLFVADRRARRGGHQQEESHPPSDVATTKIPLIPDP